MLHQDFYISFIRQRFGCTRIIAGGHTGRVGRVVPSTVGSSTSNQVSIGQWRAVSGLVAA